MRPFTLLRFSWLKQPNATLDWYPIPHIHQILSDVFLFHKIKSLLGSCYFVTNYEVICGVEEFFGCSGYNQLLWWDYNAWESLDQLLWYQVELNQIFFRKLRTFCMTLVYKRKIWFYFYYDFFTRSKVSSDDCIRLIVHETSCNQTMIKMTF